MRLRHDGEWDPDAARDRYEGDTVDAAVPHYRGHGDPHPTGIVPVDRTAQRERTRLAGGTSETA